MKPFVIATVCYRNANGHCTFFTDQVGFVPLMGVCCLQKQIGSSLHNYLVQFYWSQDGKRGSARNPRRSPSPCAQKRQHCNLRAEPAVMGAPSLVPAETAHPMGPEQTPGPDPGARGESCPGRLRAPPSAAQHFPSPGHVPATLQRSRRWNSRCHRAEHPACTHTRPAAKAEELAQERPQPTAEVTAPCRVLQHSTPGRRQHPALGCPGQRRG